MSAVGLNDCELPQARSKLRLETIDNLIACSCNVDRQQPLGEDEGSVLRERDNELGGLTTL